MYVRHAIPADTQAIARLHAKSWRTAYRGIFTDRYLDEDAADHLRRAWHDRFAHPDAARAVIVIDDGGAIVGFICIAAEDDAQWGSLIDNLHVDPSRKRAGLGRMLMLEGARWLAEHYPGTPVYLWVLERNTNARRFYERLGAANAETVLNETADGSMNSSCRYTWSSPAALLNGCGASPDFV